MLASLVWEKGKGFVTTEASTCFTISKGFILKNKDAKTDFWSDATQLGYTTNVIFDLIYNKAV